MIKEFKLHIEFIDTMLEYCNQKKHKFVPQWLNDEKNKLLKQK